LLSSLSNRVKVYRTVSLPVILYGCETVREQQRLRVLENMVLRKVFGPERKEVRGH
jgi:hypothetical protein